MFVELIEALRCPRPHQESSLIASSDRTEERHIMQGVLGCPVCQAEFPIVDGVARFGEPAQTTPLEQPSAELAMRLAAFLELTDARGFAVLCGRWGAQADQLRRIADTPLLLVNPPDGIPADVAGVLRVGDQLPLASGSGRALVLDDGMSLQLTASAVRAVRLKGRVAGPSAVPLPANVDELVRDERMWVAEKRAAPDDPAPRLVSLTRG